MYSVFATVAGHTVCLHDDTVSNSSVKLVDPVLTLEDSAAGSLTFKIAPNNVGYNEIEVEEEMVESIDSDGNVTMQTVTKTIDLVARMQSTIRVYRDGEEIWEGRVLTEDRDFQNLRDIYCEGELSYLNDTIQPQRQYSFQGTTTTNVRQFIERLFAIHNSKVEESKKFYVGTVTVDDDATSYTLERKTDFGNTLEALNSLVTDFSAHLRVRKQNGLRYVDFLADYPNTSTQQIKFGSNLLDFTCNWDMSELCTAVLPTGAVIVQAQSSCVGDPVTPLNSGGVPTTGQLLYVDTDSNTIQLKVDPSLGGYRIAVYTVEENKNYYVSCRLHGGLVAYVLKMGAGGGGMTHSYETAGREGDIGFTDYVDKKIEIPAGVKSVIVCGWGTDIPVTLKSEIEEVQGFDQYLTVEEVNSEDGWHQKGSAYVTNPELVSKYGWIERQISFSDVTSKETLYASAKAYLTDSQFDEMTIEVSAVDLSILGADADAINLLDKVRVVSEPHGLNKLFPVTKLEIPLARPADQKFTIGTKTEQTLTSVNNETNDELLNRIIGMPAVSSTLNSAKANAASMINMATNGYITFVNDSEGNPKELVISDEKDYTQAQNVWVWNVNGLCHSSTGYHSDMVNAAITMDGGIVADYIVTGTMNGVNIIAGGAGNVSGTVLVKSETTPGYCVTLKNGGIFFGYIDNYGNVTDFASMRDNKLYQTSVSYTLTTSQPSDWTTNWTAYYTKSGDDYIQNDQASAPTWTANTYYSKSSEWVRGLVLDASVLALDVSHLWVSTGPGATDAVEGYTGSFEFEDNQGNTRRMYFRNGLYRGTW